METLLGRFRRRFRIPAAAVVEVTVAGDEMLASLNRRYRRRRGPTDVLAFEIGRDGVEPRRVWLLGEVYVSIDRARAQAKERRARLIDELESLVVHGLLHLVGYGHDDDAGRDDMERTATALLDKHRAALKRETP